MPLPALPEEAAHHLHRHCVPQRGVDDAAADSVERDQSVAATAAQGDHSGGRCEREGASGPAPGGVRGPVAGQDVCAAHRQAIGADQGASLGRQARGGGGDYVPGRALRVHGGVVGAAAGADRGQPADGRVSDN